jgi:LmbE family N-acetylglucosaminyl deacetylase
VLRRAELERSASALGCARLIVLGFADSGMTGSVHGGFASLDPRVPAQQLADILRVENADVLVSYDANGGYGHPDHIQVHRAGILAADTAGVRLHLHATVDRDLMRKAIAVAALIGKIPDEFEMERLARTYASRSEITHRIDVRRYLRHKRAAMEAHCSQTEGGDTQRTLSWLLSLPSPLFRLALGREWFVEAGRKPGRKVLGDLLASLR